MKKVSLYLLIMLFSYFYIFFKLNHLIKRIIKLLNCYLELCCTYCHFKSLHPNHKILELSDVDSLKKEINVLKDKVK